MLNTLDKVSCEPCLVSTVHELTFFCTLICRFQESVKLTPALGGGAPEVTVAADLEFRSAVIVNASCGLLSGKNS